MVENLLEILQQETKMELVNLFGQMGKGLLEHGKMENWMEKES